MHRSTHSRPPNENPKLPYKLLVTIRLVEGVGAGSPVGEEQAEANSLEDAGDGTYGNGVERALLSQNLGDDLVSISTQSGR
jgi:hypothetical protein